MPAAAAAAAAAAASAVVYVVDMLFIFAWLMRKEAVTAARTLYAHCFELDAETAAVATRCRGVELPPHKGESSSVC